MDIKGIENIRAHKPIRKWDAVVLLVFLIALVAVIVVALMPKGDFVEVFRIKKPFIGAANAGEYPPIRQEASVLR